MNHKAKYKKSLSIAILICVCLIVLPDSLSGSSKAPLLVATDFYNPLQPIKQHTQTNSVIIEQLQYNHYRDLSIDDQLSSEVFDRYLLDLDPTRSYFLAADITEFETYRYQLDDALKSTEFEPAFKIFNRYQQRAVERLVFVINRLNKELQDMKFDVEEYLETDRENVPWPAGFDELDELWRKRLKSRVLNLKLVGKALDETTELLKKQYLSQLNQISQTTHEDVFQIYINALAQTYDPHTQYFSPRASKNFDISMSLSLEGIGAYLQNENEYTKVVRLIPFGPADKSNLLKSGDRIVGVGQGSDGEMVHVVGWRLDEVVQLIRGPKGTLVRLEIVPISADDEHQTKIISIVRNTVNLEEQSAQKKIIKLNRNGRIYRIGIIDIPIFYLDFKGLESGDPHYRSTTRDVRRLLNELAEVNVDGIIVDLRNNSGGALQEAAALTGLFIKQGPVVQVRSAKGKIEILEDLDPDILYNGPLSIVVNRLSASASEIFAGAIQDYHRGIIIGERTFGKGTVQSLFPLKQGQLKVTLAKFYRVTGESTQHKGVTPDILYPSLYDMEEIGESTLPGALPWDIISAVPYNTYPELTHTITHLRDLHNKRMQLNPDYRYLLEMIKHLKKTRGKTQICLEEVTRKQELSETTQWRLHMENRRRVAKNLKPVEKLTDLESDETEKARDVLPEEDPLLIETGNILTDYISLL